MIKTRGEKIFGVFNVCFLIILAFVFIFPFWDVIRISISSAAESGVIGFRLFPKQISFDGYRKVLSNQYIWSGYLNTFIRLVTGSAISMVMMVLCAYPLAKRTLPYKNVITMFIVFTMFFSGGLIPNYILIKGIGLYDTLGALILPGAIPTFSMLILRNNFMALPGELEESATIDGAGYFTILIKIILPLSKPILATVLLWCIVGHWNAWFDNLIYLKNMNDFGLQAILRKIVLESSAAFSTGASTGTETMAAPNIEVVKNATIIVSTIPILLFYPFLQKYFVKGVMVGGLKG